MQSKQPSTDGWTKKIHTHTHTHTQEYYSARKKNEILPLEATQMDLKGTTLSTEKDKYCLSLECGILK